MDSQLRDCLARVAGGGGRVTVLSGAGISAESGIPTFRGPEGYWTVGSQVYHPQEMATHAMFTRQPEAVWQWYLYRLTVCSRAEPNPGHLAIAELERLLQDRFTLITQNVDGLHLRAGNSLQRTYQIHGNVFYMRCAQECSTALTPIPPGLAGRERQAALEPRERELLKCPACGAMTRPHVLWFDETYDEPRFRFHSSLAAARETALLLVVGTSGATNLPNQVAWTVRRHGGVIVDVNPETNPFSTLALSAGGHHIRERSGTVLPRMVEVIRGAARGALRDR